MDEKNLAILKGIAAMLEYMASAEKLDVRYTQEVLKIITEIVHGLINGVEA